LIDNGADLEAKDHAGRTPLHLSASAGWNLECVTLLIEQKAKVNARDRQNNTPLHILRKNYYLKQNSCLRIAEELIKAGAYLSAVNNKGKTPMDNEHVQHLREVKPELFHKVK
jgi:ankyrin repeat protein